MSSPDLNLLVTLDVLLSEGSVARAARRLRLSPSAMSRALARLRETTGDPLLVRAGRGLVPTPRALALREQVSDLVQQAQAVLRPVTTPDLGRLNRTFTLRTREGFVENFAIDLISRIREQAPGVRLRFVEKTDRDSTALREGTVDLETAVVDKDTSPELRTQALFSDRLIGVVRAGHPLSQAAVSAAGYAAGGHVGVSMRGLDHGLIDQALAVLNLSREIVTTVPGFSSALGLARSSELIASVPERYTASLRVGLHSFVLPFPVPEFTIAMLWHPRMDADPVHRWLRGCLREVCARKTVKV
ncbi:MULTISPECIES: LysR family transcriptional regulator [unclassified Pseudomonas]|jgi:DNA-binding transcriptional LysR family regulator|uniref:LysR family transcriptional regulator n=1 Tax=unclassified Pseudomonas TaxID=196821 RepID=UPI000D6CAF12|nr:MULTISPECIES: LysR family transcriptional regulator [unclassified Pseudomonas]PWJ35081.1 LysR family transcriptional regulator [Pseudomonas sp. 43mfcvi1.1]WLH60188.1 LysR family transcriptional regulator [Pseudomonas sp. FP2300]BBH33438.1 LysR family transcriptional regulator [Pseudomonas sp. St290]SSB97129.1 DNA-binding transcriptional regulator, LysR family [Pseudomonas sp. 43mfcvi1.1]